PQLGAQPAPPKGSSMPIRDVLKQYNDRQTELAQPEPTTTIHVNGRPVGFTAAEVTELLQLARSEYATPSHDVERKLFLDIFERPEFEIWEQYAWYNKRLDRIADVVNVGRGLGFVTREVMTEGTSGRVEPYPEFQAAAKAFAIWLRDARTQL